MESYDSDIIGINQVLALWGHILDRREWHRLDDVLTQDALYDGSVFGFDRVSGIAAIRALLDNGRHALAHHGTNIFVQDISKDMAAVLSKGLGVMPGGIVSSATYTDRLVRTPLGWRIAERVLSVQPSHEATAAS